MILCKCFGLSHLHVDGKVAMDVQRFASGQVSGHGVHRMAVDEYQCVAEVREVMSTWQQRTEGKPRRCHNLAITLTSVRASVAHHEGIQTICK